MWWLRVLADIQRALTELVQHSASRGSSHRRNVAICHIFNTVWLYRKPIALGRGSFNFSNCFFLPLLQEGEGEGSTLCCWANSSTCGFPLAWLIHFKNQNPNSERDSIMPCAVNPVLKPVYRSLSLEISRIDSCIYFNIKLVCTLPIGDNFFLNLFSG